jgi:tryptophan synthase alpha chain
MVELGVPFSDPVADGPVIQNATQRALGGGATLRRTLLALREIRKGSEMPVSLMTYYNPVFHYGVENLVNDAADAGVDGLIVPDLPVEEAGDLIPAARKRDCKTVFFVAPTSTDDRIVITNKAATGFIYCVSVTGITGARDSLPDELLANLKRIRRLTDKPLVVGFGISRPEQVSVLSRHADGLIIGSAIVRRIEENLGEPRSTLVRRVGESAAGLLAGIRVA